MGRTIRIAMAVLALAGAAAGADAFEGTVRYRFTDGKGAERTLKLTVEGSKLRTEVKEGGHQTVAIVDTKAHTVTTLLPENKAYSTMAYDPAQAKGAASKGTLVKTGATDTVAGYPVQEWIYTSDRSKTSLWITDKLGAGFVPEGKSAGPVEVPWELRSKGMALRITSDRGFKMEAVEVSPGAPAPSLFTIPSDYTELSSPGAGGGGKSAEDSGAGMPADAQEQMKKAMESMTPEQRAMMEKMMQNQGAGPQ
jgi:hypothetical protein